MTNPATAHLRIGALAAATGVSIQAIRYYERRGLIAPARRRESGYREFAAEAIERLLFIRHAQQLGFSLAEVDELLRLRGQVTPSAAQDGDAVRAAIQAKRDDVARRIGQLQAMASTLDGLLAACDQMCNGASLPAECPIFEAIDHAEAPGSIAPVAAAPRGARRARSAALHPSPKGAS